MHGGIADGGTRRNVCPWSQWVQLEPDLLAWNVPQPFKEMCVNKAGGYLIDSPWGCREGLYAMN